MSSYGQRVRGYADNECSAYIVVAFYADLDGKYQLGLEKVKSVRFVFVEM